MQPVVRTQEHLPLLRREFSLSPELLSCSSPPSPLQVQKVFLKAEISHAFHSVDVQLHQGKAIVQAAHGMVGSHSRSVITDRQVCMVHSCMDSAMTKGSYPSFSQKHQGKSSDAPAEGYIEPMAKISTDLGGSRS